MKIQCTIVLNFLNRFFIFRDRGTVSLSKSYSGTATGLESGQGHRGHHGHSVHTGPGRSAIEPSCNLTWKLTLQVEKLCFGSVSNFKVYIKMIKVLQPNDKN